MNRAMVLYSTIGMSKERLDIRARQAVQAMVDDSWTPLGTFMGHENATPQPIWVRPGEAEILKLLSYIPSEKFLSWCVLQWTGPDGERVFKSLINQPALHLPAYSKPKQD